MFATPPIGPNVASRSDIAGRSSRSQPPNGFALVTDVLAGQSEECGGASFA